MNSRSYINSIPLEEIDSARTTLLETSRAEARGTRRVSRSISHTRERLAPSAKVKYGGVVTTLPPKYIRTIESIMNPAVSDTFSATLRFLMYHFERLGRFRTQFFIDEITHVVKQKTDEMRHACSILGRNNGGIYGS